MRPIIIFDLDGTLSLASHRQHYAKEGQWDLFFREAKHDPPNAPIVQLAKDLGFLSDIWIWSGRSDAVLQDTVAWLKLHDIGYTQLRMRASGDHKPDTALKLGWYRSLSEEDRRAIRCIFDDRSRLVDMWREQGITCLQAAPGDF